jgi:hypothetical protein
MYTPSIYYLGKPRAPAMIDGEIRTMSLPAKKKLSIKNALFYQGAIVHHK